MLVFSTIEPRPDDAFDRWRGAICEQFVPLRPERSPSCDEVYGELRSWPLGGLTVSEQRVRGQRIHRDSATISRSDRDVFFLTVQVAGEIGVSCGTDTKLMRAGDMYLLDARRPFILHCEGRSQGVSLTIPRQSCGGRLLPVEDLHGLVMPSGELGVCDQLLRDYLCNIARMDANLTCVERADIADHLLALTSHALTRRQAYSAPPGKAARAGTIAKAYRLIDRRLSDPDFDPSRLAREVGVSMRQLQVLFAERATSPMRTIFERRIALAKKLLQDPTQDSKSITQIAFECGFRNLSHFGRMFAQATQMSPREWRRVGERDR